MNIFTRNILGEVNHILQHDKSILLLGPRQTGKTTLINHLAAMRTIDFANPRVRLRYERDPGILIQEVEALECSTIPLIIIDEVQKVPAIMDAVQSLIDNKLAKFVLTGSSARKLKRNKDINLLPGRVIALHMDPLRLDELPDTALNLKSLLIDGSLPEIIALQDDSLREKLLDSYVGTYLEEEVRAEALVRDLAHFSHFLELAASESGYPVNMSKLSQQIGVATSTIDAYYQILEDCLIVERIEPITESKMRHRLSKAKKYLFYDLGVRRVAAREGQRPPLKFWGHLLEQFVGLELTRLCRSTPHTSRVRYWMDTNGAEVDWVFEHENQWSPIEVKWTEAPSKNDARHLKTFLNEYEQAQQGYIVCQTPNRMKLADNITAIPWQEIASIQP